MDSEAAPIWDREAECIDREELELFQFERLQATLNRVYKNVAFYRRKFDEIGFDPEEIESLEQVEKLYLTDLMKLSDAHEGIAAFMEKREPNWKHA